MLYQNENANIVKVFLQADLWVGRWVGGWIDGWMGMKPCLRTGAVLRKLFNM
jgi:hypothetical protein